MPQGLPHVRPTRPYDHSGLTLLSGSYGQMLPFSMEQPCGTVNRRFSSRSSRQDLMTSGQSPPVTEAQSAAAYTASIHTLYSIHTASHPRGLDYPGSFSDEGLEGLVGHIIYVSPRNANLSRLSMSLLGPQSSWVKRKNGD